MLAPQLKIICCVVSIKKWKKLIKEWWKISKESNKHVPNKNHEVKASFLFLEVGIYFISSKF